VQWTPREPLEAASSHSLVLQASLTSPSPSQELNSPWLKKRWITELLAIALMIALALSPTRLESETRSGFWEMHSWGIRILFLISTRIGSDSPRQLRRTVTGCQTPTDEQKGKEGHDTVSQGYVKYFFQDAFVLSLFVSVSWINNKILLVQIIRI
jgi:hypothetical protein